jgi:hypothetical protein
MDAVIGDKLFGVWNDFLVLVDEWHVPVPPVVPQFLNLPREDLTGCERPAFEGCVTGVCERISAVGTTTAGD